MPPSGRIIYTLTRASGPSGGLKVMLEHVEVLRAAGFDAVGYVKSEDQRPTAFTTTAPILVGAIAVNPEDIVIRPETFLARDLAATARGGIRQAVFVQNHLYCRHSLGDATRYSELGIDFVFCASRRIKSFLEENRVADNVPVVPCAVDVPPLDLAAKSLQVAVMPRKRPFEFEVIKHLLALRHPDLAGIPWKVIENVPHAEALKTLADAAVFLSLQRFEGFGLPALEALAAGCLVSGFLGDGAREYASSENGRWVDEDNLEAAADALAEDLRMFRDNPADAKARIDAGRRMAASYGPEPRRTALLALAETWLTPED